MRAQHNSRLKNGRVFDITNYAKKFTTQPELLMQPSNITHSIFHSLDDTLLKNILYN
ncbi:MAG: hypothetical protein ACI9T7_000520 [Oleiphilaceae bacterium]|jgi:hypothetical protein